MDQPLHLLIVEDDPADFRLLQGHLQRHGLAADCQRVTGPAELLKVIEPGGWDAVLSDFSIPGCDFFEILNVVKARDVDLPFILVSGSVGEERAVELLKLGVWDFVLKEDLTRLVPALRRSLEDAAERRAQHAIEADLRDSRLAALNMMEDAVEARKEAERVSVELLQEIAERKRAEERLSRQTEVLRESEERYRVLFETSHDAILVLGPPRYGFRKANAATLKLFGTASEAEFCQLGPTDVSPEYQPGGGASGELASTMIHLALENGSHSFEWTHRRLCGAEFPALVSLIRMELGGEILILATVRDITERKLVESELHQRLELQNQLAQVAATVPGAIYSFRMRPDGSTCIPYASPALEKIFGVRLELVREDATPFLNNIHPDDRPRVQETILASAQTLTPWQCEFRVYPTPQVETWVEGHSMPQLEPDGSVLWRGFSHDITGRKRAEAALQVSETRYRALLETAFDWIWEVDTEGRYTYASPKVLDLLGYTPAEVLGHTPFDFMPEAEAQRVGALMAPIVAERQAFGVLENVNRHKDGHLVTLETSAVPVFEPGGEFKGYHGMDRDITERKRLEAERWAMEAQMRQQQKLESIGTLAGGVAHEINNPINGVMNYAQLIQDRLPPGSPLTEYTGEILHETQRIATIVRNLLTFARDEKQSHSPASIVDIVEGTLSLIRTIVRHDQITLTVNVPADLPQLKCRSQQLQQVLMNLLTNARDALNERYPGHDPDKVLNLSAHRFEKEGKAWIRVTVEDHGSGITPEVRERMFDPFFTTKPRDKGTGLGLAISHGIVKEHHGELVVESEPGRFTRMHLELPTDNGWHL